MLPQAKSRRAGLKLKRSHLLAVFVCCLISAVLLWRASEPVEGQTRAVLAVSSSSFPKAGSIARRYTCDGANISPQLEWQNPPAGTKSFALVMDDPDTPSDFTHWLIYNISFRVRQLPEGASPRGSLPAGSREGANSFGRSQYGGPCPPPGNPHRYFFRLYALDLQLDLPAGATRQQLEAAISGHILAQGQIVGTYQRSAQ